MLEASTDIHGGEIAYGLVKPLVLAGVTVAVIGVAAAAMSQCYIRRRSSSFCCCEYQPSAKKAKVAGGEKELGMGVTTNCNYLLYSAPMARTSTTRCERLAGQTKSSVQSDREGYYKQNHCFFTQAPPKNPKRVSAPPAVILPVSFGVGGIKGTPERGAAKCIALTGLPVNKETAFFAIYDGHNDVLGDVQFIADHLYIEIDRQLEVVERDDLQLW